MKPVSLLLTLLIGFCTTPIAQAMDSWAGRKLSSVLAELRAAGLPLLYSSQTISDDLIIARDPGVTLQLERLRAVLQPYGLKLQTLPDDQGYAIVRGVLPDDVVATNAQLEEVTVFASRYNLTRADTHPDVVQLPHATLENTAGIEQDLLRSVQYLPGTSANGLSALTHVRGGYEDENLVRFDGVELYKPVHLKDFQGLFGLLDPDWAESLDFYSGAYPVRFGNHTSSVLDIRPRTQSDSRYTIGASVLYSRALGIGNYDEEAGHWLLGYRRSNLQEVLGNLEKRVGKTEFEDLLLRHRYRFAAGELRMGALRLNDEADLHTHTDEQLAVALDHDSYLWLGWRQAWSDSLNFDAQLTHTQLSSRRTAKLQRIGRVTGELDDQHQGRLFTLESTVDWQATLDTGWQLGTRLDQGEADYDYFSNANYDLPLRLTFNQPATLQRDFSQRFTQSDQSVWLALNQQWGSWRSELGLRYDHFGKLAAGSQFSPRLNVRYQLPAGVLSDSLPAASLYVSAGRYVQAQALSDLDTSVAMPGFQPPQRMQQYIVGWMQPLSPAVQLRIEAYAKHGSHLLPHAENLLSVITLASELELDRTSVAAQHSRARGAELSLSATHPHHGWWLNYSWSQAQDEINGQYLARRWDQPHALTAGFHLNHARWSWSGSGSWHSGWRYTPLIISSNGRSASMGARNAARFADFASLEVRAEYTVPLRSAALQLFMEVRNAVNHANACCREINLDQGSGQLSLSTQDGLPWVPLLGFNLQF